MCSTEAKKTWTVTNELNEMVFNPRLGDVRPEVRRPREMLIKVVKAHLDGLDYGYEYCGEWFSLCRVLLIHLALSLLPAVWLHVLATIQQREEGSEPKS